MGSSGQCYHFLIQSLSQATWIDVAGKSSRWWTWKPLVQIHPLSLLALGLHLLQDVAIKKILVNPYYSMEIVNTK